MAGPRHPEDRWFLPSVIAAAVVAVVFFAVLYRSTMQSRSFHSLDETARAELAVLPVDPRSTNDVERLWVAKDFDTTYLVAPAGPLPCQPAVRAIPLSDRPAARTAFAAMNDESGEARIESLAPISEASPHNLLVALLLGTELVRAERFEEADHIIARALDSTDLDEKIRDAAKAANTTLDLDDAQLSIVIDLRHLLGIARLNTRKEPWTALKNVIGAVKALSRKTLLGLSREQGTAARLLIPAPGCPSGTPGTLTTYDLYNNLITGYVRAESYPVDEQGRANEFGRHAKNDPRPQNLLLQAQWSREVQGQWKNEARLWALSNAKEILDLRYPNDARLNFNIAQLLDWWTESQRCPAKVCTPALLEQVRVMRDRLLLIAIKERNGILESERAEFATGITRMLAGSTVDRTQIGPDLSELATWLPPDKAPILNDLQTAAAARKAFTQWVVEPGEDGSAPFDKLGHKRTTWRNAALLDFIEAASVWASQRSENEKKDFIVAARQLLGTATAPPSLVQLEAGMPWMQRMRVRIAASRTWWFLLSLFVAAAVWFMIVFVLVQIREARALRHSFYNIELDYQRATGADGSRRKP